jgi:hypothetical protein
MDIRRFLIVILPQIFVAILLVMVTHNAGFIAVLSNSFVVGLYCFGADVFECLNSRNDKLCTET